jgi:hypothetical protein
MADDYSPSAVPFLSELKKIVSRGNHVQVFGAIQWLIRHPACRDSFRQHIKIALIEGSGGVSPVRR